MPILLALSSIAGSSPKAIFQSDRPAAAVTACVAERLAYLATPLVLPTTDGRTRIIFTSLGRLWSEVTVVAADKTAVELRGVSGGRVRRNIKQCL